MNTIGFPDHLIALERTAWEAHQAGTLTPQQAAAVQQAVTEYATEAGLDRHEVEMGVKRAVRHTQPEG
ncbi:hypothetical protein ACFZB5_13345 [Streptomyces nodosus]|uniref:hypothetical protein n=1 Tax=Streptomyces nodosus TaxID=40318 RepID=UPI0036EC1B50